MARKYLINNDTLMLTNCDYHSEIVKDHSTTLGGGLWDIDFENKTVLLYGESLDYGYVKREVLIDMIKRECYSLSFDKFKFYHSYNIKIEDAKKDCVCISIKD
jgi:hypothetical protein